MNRSVVTYLGLSLLSATLFSIPWLVPCCGWLLLLAWVPLLWIESDFEARKAKGCWKYYGLTFLLWNALTTYWIYQATLWGGIFAVIANAFQMFLIFALFRFVKRKTGTTVGYLFLTALWISWEYFYFDAEISWPWLVLGNGFANSTFLVQWYEYTGVLGGSLWIFLTNLSILKLKGGGYKKIAIMAAILVLPVAVSLIKYYTYTEKYNPVEVVVLQPNIDPYNDKFDRMSQEDQDARLLELADQSITPYTRYLFAPETAVSYVWENDIISNASFVRIYEFLQNYPHTAFIVGATSFYRYPETVHMPTETAKQGINYWYDTFNSAFQLSHKAYPFIYHKSKLVPGAEKLPYAKYLKIINNLAIDLGGGLGSFGTQPESSIFPAPWNNHPSDTMPAPLYIGVAICYESVYGEYFASYVKKGAGLMSVITNDGWWGDSPGYHQHLSYSRLRAIETRRSIARSANTGISALINQRGDYIQRSAWWEKSWLRGDLNINHKLTFYVRYGDVIGKVSVYLLVLLLVYWLVCCRYRVRR